MQISPKYSACRVQLLFWNAELLPVLDVMGADLAGFLFEVPQDGLVCLRAKMNRLLLNAGKYNLSVIVLSNDQKVLCRHDNTLAINIVAVCASGASLILPAEWTQVAGQAKAAVVGPGAAAR